MSKVTKDKDMSDIEREFEEEMRKEELPEESRLPEETEFEREYDKEMKGEELPEEKKLDPFAERFYELSNRTFKTEAELDNAVNGILNEIEREYFFKDLLKKTKKAGKFLLKKGLKTFKGVPAFQAAKGITQLARGSLKGTLGTLAKAGLKEVRAGGAVLPVLGALGFEAGEQNREAWQSFANVCKESFDYLARNLNENADDPLEASRLASEAFSAALKKVKSERKTAPVQRMTRMAVAPTQKKVVNRTMVIALGLTCLILAAGLVGSIAVYMPMVNNLQSQITEKDNTISSLNRNITDLQNTVNQLSVNQSVIAELEKENAYLSTTFINITKLQLYDLMVDNQTVNQAAGANTTVFNNIVGLAGYVTVDVRSNSTTTYVEVIYSSYGVNYDNSVTVGTSGTAAFPVLPGTVEIRVGNTEAVDSVTATVTATYWY
jgi:cell division protein FtsL